MLDNLTNRFSKVFKNIRGQAKLTEDNIKEALREVRLALHDTFEPACDRPF